jgi:hypothetical protein
MAQREGHGGTLGFVTYSKGFQIFVVIFLALPGEYMFLSIPSTICLGQGITQTPIIF